MADTNGTRLSPPPFREQLVDRGPYTMAQIWQRWLEQLWQGLKDLHDGLAAVSPTLGPWTPTLVGTTGGSAHTYTVQWGQAVRTGRHVTLAATLQLSAKDGSMGGTVSLAGLPVPMIGAVNAFVPVVVAFSNVNLTGSYMAVAGGLAGGEQVLRLYEEGKGLGWNPLPASTITNTTELAVSGSYWSA
jgi:hypothetical protein